MGRQLALKLWVSRFSAKASQTAGVELEEMPLSPMLRPDPMLSFGSLLCWPAAPRGNDTTYLLFISGKLVIRFAVVTSVRKNVLQADSLRSLL